MMRNGERDKTFHAFSRWENMAPERRLRRRYKGPKKALSSFMPYENAEPAGQDKPPLD